jgi:hypothetical protein
MLEYLGYQAECETDGQSALKIFSDNPDRFDFAVIEPILPDLTVLFYAGYVDEALSLRIEADHLGQVAFKPFRLNELAAAIRDRLPPGSKH